MLRGPRSLVKDHRYSACHAEREGVMIMLNSSTCLSKIFAVCIKINGNFSCYIVNIILLAQQCSYIGILVAGNSMHFHNVPGYNKIGLLILSNSNQ